MLQAEDQIKAMKRKNVIHHILNYFLEETIT